MIDIKLDLRRHLTNKWGYIWVAVKTTYSTRSEEMCNKSAAANNTQCQEKERAYLALTAYWNVNFDVNLVPGSESLHCSCIRL